MGSIIECTDAGAGYCGLDKEERLACHRKLVAERQSTARLSSKPNFNAHQLQNTEILHHTHFHQSPVFESAAKQLAAFTNQPIAFTLDHERLIHKEAVSMRQSESVESPIPEDEGSQSLDYQFQREQSENTPRSLSLDIPRSETRIPPVSTPSAIDMIEIRDEWSASPAPTPSPINSDLEIVTEDKAANVSPHSVHRIYKSNDEMYESERIENLLKSKLPCNVENTLGDSLSFKLPEDEPQKSQIERDLRKIKVSLLEYKLEEAEQRKYAKLCILKYYDLLTSIYKRYCKIGRDTQWMTMFGWISLLRDCGMVKMQIDEQQYVDIFHRVYQYHHEHFHSAHHDRKHSRHTIQQSETYGDTHLHDKDPWTGTWMLQRIRKRVESSLGHLALLSGDHFHNDSEVSSASIAERYHCDSNLSVSTLSDTSIESLTNARIQYKFRKIGDRKLIGHINDSRHLTIEGWLHRNDFKRSSLKAKSIKKPLFQNRHKRRQRRHVPLSCFPMELKKMRHFFERLTEI